MLHQIYPGPRSPVAKLRSDVFERFPFPSQRGSSQPLRSLVEPARISALDALPSHRGDLTETPRPARPRLHTLIIFYTYG